MALLKEKGTVTFKHCAFYYSDLQLYSDSVFQRVIELYPSFWIPLDMWIMT